MTDTEALEVRSTIRTLFPAGPARERWLAWADRIQHEESCDTGWTRRPKRARILRMQLELSANELETAARACRAMAYQEGERAKKMENPGMRAPIENAVWRYAALAEKFEAARKRA
jgi:hypothetical protein